MNDAMHVVRRSETADARRVWEIRYHPLVNQTALAQTVAPFEEHEPWFSRRYCSPDSADACFVLCAGDMVIGYCRFDRKAEEFIVSIALDPAYHGQGLGTLFLEQALEQLNPDVPIMAVVRKNNPRSQTLFANHGFEPVGEQDDCMIFRLKY